MSASKKKRKLERQIKRLERDVDKVVENLMAVTDVVRSNFDTQNSLIEIIRKMREPLPPSDLTLPGYQ